MVRIRFQVVSAVLLTAFFLSGCDAMREKPAPPIGETWAGPATLPLRKEIDPKSPVVGNAVHGEHLDITGRRRRWYKVRTASGKEGWVDDRQLLDKGQMDRLQSLAKETEHLQSHGLATTFQDLNVHTEPNRFAPSFLQVHEKEKFDVIAHRVAARKPLPPRSLLPPPEPKKKASKKDKDGDRKKGVELPPPPAAPTPPTDWLEISKTRPQAPEDDSAPVPGDDWTLIRTPAGQSGWVLTSRVYMLIPDEVAQYAEGHRITSYFSIGKVPVRGEADRDIWLWTTSERLGEDHDFDGFRVFTWNGRKHRYETAFIQRRERGFFPVLAKSGEFSVCLEKADGSRIRKFYTLNGNSVRGAGEKPCEDPGQKIEAVDVADTSDMPHIAVKEVAAAKGYWQRLKDRVNGVLGRKPQSEKQ